MFVPLKVTTDYSMLQSMITIPKLLSFLQKYQIKACGICDKNLFGIMEFYDTMMQNQITPIIGLEVKIDFTTFYLYARNYRGYQALLHLSELSEKNELTLQEIETNQTHLNVVCPFYEAKDFTKYQTIFTHFYLGYTSEYEKNNALILTPNIVFCPDIKAFTRSDAASLPILKAIDLNESVKLLEPKNEEKNTFEYYLNDKDYWEEDIESFIKTCHVEIPKQNQYIPKFQEEKDSKTYLISLAKKGLEKRLGGIYQEEYLNRLKYELSVIEKMGFADYFLIVYDYVRYAKTNGILVGAGRGSAVGSLVSYCLGITNIDPLKYHLLFERFLNPERITMPDIDIDFEEERRDEVVSYVKNRYGSNCVANIMTFGTLKSKLVLRSVGKALEINQNVLDSFVNKIDAKLSLKENLTKEDVRYYVNQNKDIKKLYEESSKIEGLKKHISTHAAGVVISSVPLNTLIPVHYNGEELLTGITMNYLEELGLLKMDFLALRNLTIMKNVLKLIETHTNKTLQLNQIDLNDPKVLQLFTDANTIGIFQFESEGMKGFLRKLKPSQFLDLVSAIALYRPGPMENIDSFIKRKEGKEKINYYHEDLKPILEETYGILVYQEQIMQILVKMGGFSFAEADNIRRAMSKKKKEIILESEERFLKGAIKNGYSKTLASEIFALILKFANYGFNKSHSVSYAYIGYQMAYLKCYYPIFFIANLLNMNVDGLQKTMEYIAMAKKMNIKILPPDINISTTKYELENNSLRMPFTILKNLGEEASRTITLKRGEKPFSDFFDFVARSYGKSITKKTIETLIKGGALDSFTTNHNALRANLDAAINYATLASDLEENFITKPNFIEIEEETKEEKRKEEYESFGFYISNHPASKYLDSHLMKLEHIKSHYDEHVECVVLLEKIKEITTKNGDAMAFVTASDETDTGNFVVFSATMQDLRKVKIGDILHIKGRVARRFSDYQINVNKIEKIEAKGVS